MGLHFENVKNLEARVKCASYPRETRVISVPFIPRVFYKWRARQCALIHVIQPGPKKRLHFAKLLVKFFYVISVTFSTLVREVSKQRWFPDQVVIAFLCLLWISHSKITWYPLDIIQREIAKKMWRHTSQFFRREPILKTSFVIFSPHAIYNYHSVQFSPTKWTIFAFHMKFPHMTYRCGYGGLKLQPLHLKDETTFGISWSRAESFWWQNQIYWRRVSNALSLLLTHKTLGPLSYLACSISSKTLSYGAMQQDNSVDQEFSVYQIGIHYKESLVWSKSSS